MTNNGVFQIKFEDGTTFVGNLFKSQWREVPNKKRIKEITFSFGDRSVKLENYREYNIAWETHAIVGKNTQSIVNITLAGRAEDYSTVMIFDCINGKLSRKKVDKFSEYPWNCPTWKQGITNGVPKDYHA